MMKRLAIFSFLILANFFVHAQAVNKNTSSASKRTILFVCEHGAGRSAIAAAFFNRMTKEQNLNYHAIFRGIHPDSAVGTAIRNGLIKDSFDINGWKPILLSKQDIQNAHRVVTLDCLLPENGSSAYNSRLWTGIPIGKGYIEARDEIINKLQPLVLELKKEESGKN